MHTIDELREKQALPLDLKIALTRNRVRAWINEFGESGVYVSFSGGKDSTVLLDIVRNVCGYKDIPAVFVDIPTQYPELREFVKTYTNTVIIKPNINFFKVCEKYGFPLISKEVANNVDGARKYLIALADRQTDRQTDVNSVRSECLQLPYSYNYRRICGIGEYSKQGLGKNKRQPTKVINNARDVDQDGEGEYP